jgi:hypothetical protein
MPRRRTLIRYTEFDVVSRRIFSASCPFVSVCVTVGDVARPSVGGVSSLAFDTGEAHAVSDAGCGCRILLAAAR